MIRSARRSVTVLTALLVAACGGGPPPESADDVAASEPPEAAAEEEASAPASEPKEETSPEPAKESGGEASEEDRRSVLNLVLGDEELGKYLRLGEPGRFPLKVSGSDLPDGLLVMTKPVQKVDSPEPKAAVLVITGMEVGAKKASVSYRFDAEGIKGTTTLERGPRGWEILRSRIVEHFRADADADGSKSGKGRGSKD